VGLRRQGSKLLNGVQATVSIVRVGSSEVSSLLSRFSHGEQLRFACKVPPSASYAYAASPPNHSEQATCIAPR
jgi:hypothetical protein